MISLSQKKRAAFAARLWITGLWITFSVQTGLLIIAKKRRNFKGSRPVDNLMNLLEFINLSGQGLVDPSKATTRFMILPAVSPGSFPVFHFFRFSPSEKLTINSQPSCRLPASEASMPRKSKRRPVLLNRNIL